MTPIERLDADRLWRMLRPTAIAGGAICLFIVGSFFLWSVAAPLASAAIASGSVSPEGSRRTIQHLEGGIIRAIHVREGDIVEAGQLLYTLEPTQAQAQLDRNHNQLRRLRATLSRLEAHLADKPSFEPDAEFRNDPDPDFRAFIENQQQLFVVRRRSVVDREESLRLQISQIKQEIASKQAEATSLRQQIRLLVQEINDKVPLVARGLVRRPEVLVLQRMQADAEGRLNGALADIARATARISETELAITNTRIQFLDQIHDQIMKTNADVVQAESGSAAARDVVTRLEIRAPIRGTALNPRFRTIGGVVRPGEAVLDLVPNAETLVIEANLSPNDIDVTRVGLSADIVFTPFNNRYLPRLKGRVVRVAADAMRDERAGTTYYPIRVEVDRTELAKLGDDHIIQAGMPVEVFVVTGTRTFAGYLLQPLSRSFARAFRED